MRWCWSDSEFTWPVHFPSAQKLFLEQVSSSASFFLAQDIPFFLIDYLGWKTISFLNWIKQKAYYSPWVLCNPTRQKALDCFLSLFNACHFYSYYYRTTSMVTATTSTTISNSGSDRIEPSREEPQALIVEAPSRRSSLWVVSPEVASYFIGE